MIDRDDYNDLAEEQERDEQIRYSLTQKGIDYVGHSLARAVVLQEVADATRRMQELWDDEVPPVSWRTAVEMAYIELTKLMVDGSGQGREGLVQLAAMCVAAIEDRDRFYADFGAGAHVLTDEDEDEGEDEEDSADAVDTILQILDNDEAPATGAGASGEADAED